jgi:fumarate reductase subunit C
MSETPIYTEHHPRWYRTRPSTYWWLKRGPYLVFILRELSSLFVAWAVVFTLLQVRALRQGPDAYQAFREWSRAPVVVALNVVSLFFVAFHAVTWLNLAPKAMVVRLRGQRVPGHWLLAGNYAAWALVSAILAWLILKG